jgi:hypothetical protein
MAAIQRVALLVSIVCIGIAGCSSTPNEQPAQLVNAAVENPDEVSCRTIVKTGTRVGTRVCKTNRAWALGNSQGRNMAEDIQRKAYQSVGDPNAGG